MRQVQNRPASRSGIDLPEVKVPALIAATWSDQGLHSRGSFEGYKTICPKTNGCLLTAGKNGRCTTATKHCDTKLTFLIFIKELDNDLRTDLGSLEVRETRDTYFVRYVDSWPVPDAEYRPLYLNAANGQLELTEQDNRSEVTYDPLTESATFSLLFDEDTELSGNMKLKLWVSTTEGEDMDLFTAVDKLDRNGTKIDFAKMSYIYGPVALGWLRVSARAR